MPSNGWWSPIVRARERTGIFIIDFTHFTASSPMIVITVEEKGLVFGLNRAARYLMGETVELDTFGFYAWLAQLLLELKTKIRFYPVRALIWQPKK
jgi:hypothetical protein